MYSREIENEKQKLKLSLRQRHILVGLLLGDGHLETRNGRVYRLKVEHGEKQKEYVEWLFEEFKPWIRATKPYKKTRKNGKVNYGFTTYSHGSFRFYAQQFYKEKKKIIPNQIKKILAPLSIAIWFLDDGSKKSDRHRSLVIHTVGFKKSELQKIASVLCEKYDIHSSLHKQRNDTWRLYIPSVGAKKIAQYTKEVLDEVPSLRYKVENINLPKL